MRANHVLTLTRLSFILLLTVLSNSSIADGSVAEVHDFNALQQEMENKKLPLLLAFRADYCGFCKRLEKEHLVPMENSGKYATRILIRQFSMGNDETIVDFNGDKMDADEFATRHDVSLTPTLLFLNAQGKEVAERLLGYNSPDFYGAYLEQAIDTAQQATK